MEQKNARPPSVDGSIYIPMDGPWESEEDDKAFAEAEGIFNEQKEIHPYVALIKSANNYSHGYWVEIKENKVAFPDAIIKIHKANK